MNIGVRPTFADGSGELVEVHVLDFEGDLYGQELQSTSSSGSAARSASTTPRSSSSRWSSDVAEAANALQTAG